MYVRMSDYNSVNMAVAPSTRRPRADGERSRQKILYVAADLATVEGLNGLSIGEPRDPRRDEQERPLCALRSKEELELATVEPRLGSSPTR